MRAKHPPARQSIPAPIEALEDRHTGLEAFIAPYGVRFGSCDRLDGVSAARLAHQANLAPGLALGPRAPQVQSSSRSAAVEVVRDRERCHVSNSVPWSVSSTVFQIETQGVSSTFEPISPNSVLLGKNVASESPESHASESEVPGAPRNLNCGAGLLLVGLGGPRKLRFDAAIGVPVKPASETNQGFVILAVVEVHYLEPVSATHGRILPLRASVRLSCFPGGVGKSGKRKDPLESGPHSGTTVRRWFPSGTSFRRCNQRISLTGEKVAKGVNHA
jgi:hypothetical protein